MFYRLKTSLRVLLALTLVLAGLPARAERVCVFRGRVVAACPMTTAPKASMADCPMRERSCCAPRQDRGTASVVHCEFVTSARPILAVKTSPVAWANPLHPFVSDPPLRPSPLGEPDRGDEVGFSRPEIRPPRARPYVPDRGRAPPVNVALAA